MLRTELRCVCMRCMPAVNGVPGMYLSMHIVVQVHSRSETGRLRCP